MASTFASSAQRRPGREPRRHAVFASATIRRLIAQRRPGREPGRHNNNTVEPSHLNPLNEGRGVNPGDTRDPRAALNLPLERSTKAGA